MADTRLFLRGLLLAVCLACAGTARADAMPPPIDKAHSSGLALGTGVGSDNVGFGGHALYYLQTHNPRLRVALHLGAGAVPLPGAEPAWGVRGGAFLAFGRRHRLVAGVLGGTMGWSDYWLHGTEMATSQLLGAGVGVGWEYMSRRGFYLRATFGPGFAVMPEVPLRARETHLVWTGNLLALGYKLW